MSFAVHPASDLHARPAHTDWLSKLIFVDLETTGTALGYDRITEIGLVWYCEEQGWQSASSLVNPGIRIPPAITELTGISDAMVASAPSFADLHEALLALLKGRILVAHNVRFDYGFLSRELARCDKVLGQRHLCTLRLSRLLEPDQIKHGLATLAERWQLKLDNHHRALADAKALAHLWLCWQQQFDYELLDGFVRKAIREVHLPPQLELGDLTGLPDGPGVYLFYGEDQNLLYIGKSIDLRSRVFSHFSDALHNSKEAKMVQQTRRIEHICCAGDLGAQLLESRLIKERSPLYNRRLRRKQQMQTWQLEADEEGFLRPVLIPLGDVPASEIHRCYGLFSKAPDASRALQGIVKKNRLCLARTGLEQRQGPCFGYQLKQCAGACCGEESAERYNLRLRMALGSLEIAWWPFEGALCVKEHSDINRCTQWHLLHHWRYLGSFNRKPGARQLKAAINGDDFDLDTYKILQRQLRQLKPDQVSVLAIGRDE